MDHRKLYTEYCNQLQDIQKYRVLPAHKTAYAKALLDFSTNDYLGLSQHPELLAAAYDYGCKYGVGATGARLLSGNHDIFESLEKQISMDKNTEAALIYNTGYQANLSVLSALCNQKALKNQAVLFFDKLNHSSLYQGAMLCDAHMVRFKHNDMQDLERLLSFHQDDERPKFIVAQTIYGMDGDVAPLAELIDLAKHFNALLYLDEAHATGILGPKGYGLSTTIDFGDVPVVIMGTFSKALGVCGAYVACNQGLKDYLVNKSEGFIYSTALSPMVIGAVQKAWELIPTLHLLREKLFSNGVFLREELKRLGFDTGTSSTHIIPIILKDEEKVLKAKELLGRKGIIVAAIRPPTVAVGSSRLRIALTAQHTDADMDKLITALHRSLRGL